MASNYCIDEELGDTDIPDINYEQSESDSGEDDETNASTEQIQLQENDKFTARKYQLELFNCAKNKNSILVLGTGSGKTFISILLIREFADQIRGSMQEGNKRTIFCVNTVPLVYQQGKAIENHTGLKVGKYEGSMGVDFWSDERWQEELDKYEVLVLTAQILLELILHARLPLRQVNLMIMDECHHAVGSHPMREIMRQYDSLKRTDPDSCPRIMGLTASVINKKCKSHEVSKCMHDLELTMDSALVTSVDQDEVKYHTTRPKEVLIMYKTEGLSSYQDKIENQLCGIQMEIDEMEGLDPKVRKFVKKRIENIKYIMKSLGDWCVARAVHYEVEHLEESAVLEEVPVVRELLGDLRTRFQTIYRVCVKEEAKLGNPIDHVSHHVKRLAEILHGFDETVLGLIFVERRNTAKIMYDLLLEIAKQNNRLAYVKPLYVVGVNARPSTDLKLAELELRKQKETLNKFKNGEANFIVSTSVLEEGVDIRKCNVVIRFDKPMNFRAYVQSRGRARAVPSCYILMVKEGDYGNFINDLDVYKETEKSLLALCHDRDLPTSEETTQHFDEDEYIPPYEPYGPSGPKVTANSAVSLINHYIGKLPQDRFTELAPDVYYVKNDIMYVKAGILLPVSAKLHSRVFGDYMAHKDLAKKSAALEVCKVLHGMGELNDYIRPVAPSEVDLLDGLLDVELEPQKGGQPGLGTKRHRQIYEREICRAFTNVGGVHQLYAIDIEPVGQHLREFTVDSSKSKLKLGIVCSGVLIHCPFNLFGSKFGEVSIKVKHVGELPDITDELMKKIANFHKLSMEILYRINTSLMEFNPKDFGHDIYIVPLEEDAVSIEFLNKMTEEPLLRKTTVNRDKNSLFSFKRSQYEGAVIFPKYGEDPFVMYYVTDILDHLNPKSEFPESKMLYENYEGYFKAKYNVSITNTQQPLLAAKHIPKELNYLKKMMSKKKSDREPPNFVPELCGILPFKLDFWWQLSCIPSILHRLNSFGVAYRLCGDVGVFPVPTLNFMESLAFDFKWAGKLALETAATTNLAVALARKDMEYIHPYMLVHALTLLGSNDGFNLERLEVLGDAFLKFVVGDFVFLRYPDDHEGKLSPRRTLLVCNRTLYQLGSKKMLPNKIQAVKLSPKVNGFIPGFGVKRQVEQELRSLEVPHDKWYKLRSQGGVSDLVEAVAEVAMEVDQNENTDEKSKKSVSKALCYNPWREHDVSDKSVADSIEALIGAYLLKCGSNAAKAFLHWLGIGVCKGRPLLNDSLPILSAVLKMDSSSRPEVNRIYRMACLDRLEDILHYRFQDRSFIVQAVTHTSYSSNRVTNNYQRLEFIGDAVLDYFVTCLIYSKHTSCTPGQMTDMRSYFVNNETLARVAARFGLQSYLLHMAPKLQATIDKFLTICNEGGQENVLITEEDEEDIEEIQVPKCLGDLIEAIIGAVYLDSQRNLEVTWQVIHRLMGDIFEKDYQNIEKNCVRQLFEKLPANVEFVKVPHQEGCKAAYIVKINDTLEIRGEGKNFKVAKSNAAKKALKKLQDMAAQRNEMQCD